MVLPSFATARLALTPRSMADFDACLAMDQDPQVTRHIHGPWADPAAHRAFLRDRIQADHGPGLGYWTIRPRDDRAEDAQGFLGWILLIPLDALGPEIEIGWRLPRHAWGQGLATEAARPILDHGLRTLGLPKIVADIHTANPASLAVAAKLGLRPTTTWQERGDQILRHEITPADLAP